MKSFSQPGIIDRQPFAAGRFYAADKEQLRADLSSLFSQCRKFIPDGKVRAIISPHAGYVFSGVTAAAAYSSVPKSGYKNIFVIGSSHIMSFNGASVWNTGDYITPLGKVSVNKDIAGRLKKENSVFDFPSTSHLREHSLEVQMPFIQYYFTDSPQVIPIIIGTEDETLIKQITEALRPWFTSDNLFVISSDFSHYPSYNDAIEADRNTAQGIISGDPDIFLNTLKSNSGKKIKGQVTSMCGWTSGLLLLYLTGKSNDFEYHKVDYSNSGDSRYGSKDEVVGYNALVVSFRGSENRDLILSFDEKEKEQLFSIARNSIRESLLHGDYKVPMENLSTKLKEAMGAFVTLKLNGKLRGCIGRFISQDALYEVVKASALSSAFEDPRFSPLTREEFNNIEIEITVLGPLKKISDYHEIKLGRHGIYIKKDGRSGTMLPQVAIENNWTVEEFLGITSREKAGIGYDGWKDAELFIYEGVVLEEKR